MIDGVLIKPLKQIPDERGKVMYMLRRDDPWFDEFGEIYFSIVYPSVIKGWHLHLKMALNYACVSGTIKLVLYDDRENSPTRYDFQEIFLGDSNYCLVHIPPNVWNGFKGIGIQSAIVANCSDIPHNLEEIIRLDPFDPKIPYDWGLKHR